MAKADEALAHGTTGETSRILRILGRTQKPELIERTLNAIIEKSLSSRFTSYILQGIQANPMAIETALNWTETRWSDLINKSEGGPVFVLSRLISVITTRKDIDRVRAFISDPTKLQYQVAVNAALDVAMKKVAWVERDTEKLKTWLQEAGGVDVAT
jgi:hypothetical protein